MSEINTETFETVVAAVLDEKTVVIVGGRDVGLKVRHALIVQAENSPVEIRDPVTREHLGTIQLAKAALVVTEVHEHIAVCHVREHKNFYEVIRIKDRVCFDRQKR